MYAVGAQLTMRAEY
ncbi:hypothetical protein MXU80_00660 [Klebsiella pneumoniae]|nr:hypothetical protein [Klebsiella pneumoniae]MCF0358047.1 hypothetical protein [Klebsiella pneumoniae]MCF6833559.1 hypothetical protein [Klebsiella pneumoniae]MCF6901738.1 hypothetical protein [Klebsiella pneumoniae]MCF6979323.1 hypothetical protein [Klebsiella pneumoniae]MCJ5577417.1 hypothetical protein [Klebsiella pneumoniae]